MSAHGCTSVPCTICGSGRFLSPYQFETTTGTGEPPPMYMPVYTKPIGCACPDFWWGIVPPPCPVHNPPTWIPWVSTGTDSVTITTWPPPKPRAPFADGVIPQIGWKK